MVFLLDLGGGVDLGGRRIIKKKKIFFFWVFFNDKFDTIEGVHILFKEKCVKAILGEEIQKDFFEETADSVELNEESRKLISYVRGKLKSMSEELERTLSKVG